MSLWKTRSFIIGGHLTYWRIEQRGHVTYRQVASGKYLLNSLGVLEIILLCFSLPRCYHLTLTLKYS